MDVDKFTEKLKRSIPEEHRINFIVTSMGVSANLVQFIMDNHNISDMPPMVQYCCAICANHMLIITSDGENIIPVNVEEKYKMGEQTQEGIYRKMKWVVEQLYKYIQERESTNNE